MVKKKETEVNASLGKHPQKLKGKDTSKKPTEKSNPRQCSICSRDYYSRGKTFYCSDICRTEYYKKVKSGDITPSKKATKTGSKVKGGSLDVIVRQMIRDIVKEELKNITINV